MKLRNLLLILTALIMVAFMVGCSDSDEDEGPGNYTLQTGDEFWLGDIEKEDMDGYEFRIFTRKGNGWIHDQYVEEQTGDIINDAVFKRNETVKGYFNIDITAVQADSDSANEALNNILAGDDEYDVLFPHARTAFQYALQDSVVNFLEVSTINLDKEWWSKDIVDSCEVNGHLYVLDGDISTKRLNFAYAVFFNKRIFDELGLDYPYQMVKDGTWTFDEFAKLVKQGSKDLNGDGIIKEPDDQFGYYAIDWFGPFSVLYSGGQRIYTKDATGIPQLTLNSSKTTTIYSKFFDLAKSDNCYIRLDGSGIDLFSAGQAMFADENLGNAIGLRGMSDEFGILPYPKYSVEDDYTTLIGGGSSLMVMPITVSDYERTGKIIEALCAIGNRDVIPAFYDVSLKSKHARDQESEEMIDIIKNSLVYDLGYLSGGELNNVGYDLAHQTTPDFASYYAKKESMALIDLRDFIETYGKLK